MSTIWLLRHAESEWNAAGRWQGHGDPPLSGRGRVAAAQCAPGIARRVGAVRLFCSDLMRAVETASYVGRALGCEPTRVTDLRELDVGSWTGLERAAIEDRDGRLLAAFESDDPDVRPGGGETRGEIRLRTRAAVERLTLENHDWNLLLVVHLGVIRALVPGAEPDHLELFRTDLEAIRRARANLGPTG